VSDFLTFKYIEDTGKDVAMKAVLQHHIIVIVQQNNDIWAVT